MVKNPDIRYLLSSVPKRCLAAVSYFYKRYNIDWTRNYLLVEIGRRGGSCSFDALISSTYYTPGAVTKQLQRIEKAGYITTALEPGSRKKKQVALTETGSDYVAKIIDFYREIEAVGTRSLTTEQKADFIAMLRQIFLSYEAATEPPYTFASDYPQITFYFSSIIRLLEKDEQSIPDLFGLKTYEAHILCLLAYNGRKSSFKQLERSTVQSQSSIASLARRLEEKGLLLCTVAPDDNRVCYADLTPEGAAVARRLLEYFKKDQNKHCREFSDRKLEALHHYLLTYERNIMVEYGD